MVYARGPRNVCAHEGCQFVLRFTAKRPFCRQHYFPSQRAQKRTCGATDCATPIRSYNVIGYCDKHRYGDAEVCRKHADSERARRARKLGAFIEDVDRCLVWERDEGICNICFEPADESNWHLDHVIPLSFGGEHSYANTAVSHPFCNLSKGGANRGGWSP